MRAPVTEPPQAPPTDVVDAPPLAPPVMGPLNEGPFTIEPAPRTQIAQRERLEPISAMSEPTLPEPTRPETTWPEPTRPATATITAVGPPGMPPTSTQTSPERSPVFSRFRPTRIPVTRRTEAGSRRRSPPHRPDGDTGDGNIAPNSDAPDNPRGQGRRAGVVPRHQLPATILEPHRGAAPSGTDAAGEPLPKPLATGCHSLASGCYSSREPTTKAALFRETDQTHELHRSSLYPGLPDRYGQRAGDRHGASSQSTPRRTPRRASVTGRTPILAARSTPRNRPSSRRCPCPD